MSHQAGTFTAKIKDYGFSCTKNGDPQFAVVFTYKESENVEKQLTYFGSFKEKALDSTLDTMAKMGYQGQDMKLMYEGITSGILNVSQDYEIVISLEEFNGKTYPKVKWVNLPGESQFKRMDMQQTAVKLSGLNIDYKVKQKFGQMNNGGMILPDSQTTATNSIPF